MLSIAAIQLAHQIGMTCNARKQHGIVSVDNKAITMNELLTRATKQSNKAIATMFIATILCAYNGRCQQLGVGLTFAKYNDFDSYQVESRGPGYALSFDNINFSSEKKYFVGGQLGYIPTIYVQELPSYDSWKIMKLAGSVYGGRLLKLSNTFFLSGSAGANLGYGQIKNWDTSSWTKVPQFLVGLRTAEQLHIRVKHSAIIFGFEQWFMINSSTISSFKVGYSFNLGKK